MGATLVVRGRRLPPRYTNSIPGGQGNFQDRGAPHALVNGKVISFNRSFKVDRDNLKVLFNNAE